MWMEVILKQYKIQNIINSAVTNMMQKNKGGDSVERA